MNAEVKYGIDDPEEFLQLNNNLEYVATHLIRKEDNNLHGLTKFIFNNLYCGKLAPIAVIILSTIILIKRNK